MELNYTLRVTRVFYDSALPQVILCAYVTTMSYLLSKLIPLMLCTSAMEE